jgi:hypothetical protein
VTTTASWQAGGAWKRAAFVAAVAAVAAAWLAAGVLIAMAEPQQTRVYDARGNSVGTIVPQGDGSTRHYDARGNSLGTSTLNHGTTTYYSPLGSVTGKTVGPTPTDRRK